MEKQKAEAKKEDNGDEGPSSSSGTVETEESSVEKIRKYLALKLGIRGSQNETDPPILTELSIDGIAEFIKSSGCRKIITMAGAGISTSAGIPDFRSPKSGLYHNLEKYNLPHPQAIFELEYFADNPEPFFVLAKELMPVGFKPTPSHYFIRLLWEKGLLLRHYTQNIDTLERVAGLPGEVLVEAHGTFHTGHCLRCETKYTLEWMKERILGDVIPMCENCKKGIIKPDIVFFGEVLPERFHTLVDKDFDQADLLIIMGTSLVVQPFASLVDKDALQSVNVNIIRRVHPRCPRLLINKEKVGMQDLVMKFLGLKHGLMFDSADSSTGRDVAWLGDCDTGCYVLADKLGWGDEMQALIEQEYKKIDIGKPSDDN